MLFVERWCVLVVVVLASEAAANPAISVQAGGGLPTDSDSTGQTSSLIVGGALRLDHEDRWWSPRFALDVRRINGEDSVGIGDFTSGFDTRAIGVRALAGIRLEEQHDGAHGFAQASLGLEWQRSSWEELVAGRPGPTKDNGTQHHSDTGAVFELAMGCAVRHGRTTVGAQAAVATWSKPTSMPINVNETEQRPVDLLVTLFVETRL